MASSSDVDQQSSDVDQQVSLFDEVCTTTIASQVRQILKDPVRWNNVHHHSPDYLDIVKVRYRTFFIESPASQTMAKLPSMFGEEFSLEMYKYNTIVDQHGNEFEVIAENLDGVFCFTHGWSDIRSCYIDAEGKDAWASITYIRPRLFVLILKDRYYRDFVCKHFYPATRLRLCHTIFGPDDYLGSPDAHIPYRHDASNFTHNFIVIVSRDDVESGCLKINYGYAARTIMPKDSVYLKLVDEKGLEWYCTVESLDEPSSHLRLGGRWKTLAAARGYGAGSHLMFGKPRVGDEKLVFLKKIY